MMDPRWRYGRAALRRCLVALLPDDDWSQEFLGELDDELALRARSRHGPGLTIWYVRQLFSRADNDRIPWTRAGVYETR